MYQEYHKTWTKEPRQSPQLLNNEVSAGGTEQPTLRLEHTVVSCLGIPHATANTRIRELKTTFRSVASLGL